MPGSVPSLVNPRDDFISLQDHWKNRPRNRQLPQCANYSAGGMQRDTTRDTDTGPLGVRECSLQLTGRSAVKEVGDFQRE